MRCFLLLALTLLLVPIPSRAERAQTLNRRQAAIGEVRALLQRLRQDGSYRSPLKPGQLARVRGLLAGSDFSFSAPPINDKQRNRGSRDATFVGRHPMFQRLARSGWYRDPKIGELQLLADQLRLTRSLDPSTPLSKVEYLAFDLEASGGSSGHFDQKKNKLLLGWDEITQFGYTIYRPDGTKVSHTIKIRPDVEIQSFAERLTGLSAKKLAKASRFEQVAKQILSLMKGRILVGQDATRNDWGWLQSNFARIGVDLPSPRGLILDTYLLSFHTSPVGMSLKKLAERYQVKSGREHDAGADAQATGEVLGAMLREKKAVTIGDAFRLQEQAQQIMHQKPNL